MSIYAIGDVQGCYDDLMRLLEAIAFDPAKDRLWFAGDLVNRGPQSVETLRFVKGLGGLAVTVLGNHELHLSAAACDEAVLRRSRDIMGDVLVAPDREELLAWIRTLPLMHHDAGLGFALIHAGLPPQWDLAQAQACAREVETVLRSPDFPELFKHMYGNEPHRWADDLSGWERLRFIINCFTRLRYCDSEGYVALHEKSLPGQQPAPLLPWYAVPGRRSRGLRIIFGHWSTLGRYAGDNVYCLDTGCVWGGRLTALRLDDMRWFGVACAGACEPGEE